MDNLLSVYTNLMVTHHTCWIFSYPFIPKLCFWPRLSKENRSQTSPGLCFVKPLILGCNLGQDLFQRFLLRTASLSQLGQFHIGLFHVLRMCFHLPTELWCKFHILQFQTDLPGFGRLVQNCGDLVLGQPKDGWAEHGNGALEWSAGSLELDGGNETWTIVESWNLGRRCPKTCSK